MISSLQGTASRIPAAFAALYLLAGVAPACAQTAPAPAPDAAVTDQQTPTPEATLPAQEATPSADQGPETDILSKRTLSVLLDARLVLANGHQSFVDGGLGKTRFDGTASGDFKARAVPVEADLIWAPRFTGSLSANVSAAWQRDQENDVDLLEAFVTFLPQRNGNWNFSAKAGLYWPEISLEHATGGAWSTVYTITPSAINSWVGEEVKVVGAEATVTAGLGQHEIAATGGLFGFNDTSGTLLSFRGWALQDIKATTFGHFPLPPLNSFIVHLQEGQTRSLIEIDHRVGFYGRLEWRPPWPFVLNAYYYDNRGNPKAFEATGQWGWRTRFLNVGLSADIAPGTRLIAQAMTGSTHMGFQTRGVDWVHTSFQSAFALVTHEIGRGAITGRAEIFSTREHGSQMSPNESEDGWALTGAGRLALTNSLTAFIEVLHVRSDRGTRANLGIPAFEAQTVMQAALRFRW
ncbi:MAG: hypothetical protein JWN66_4124 [Sphingomonas bacterium]|uniref:hypothetical protein n=1 Tax=Sphingomonas bacterium TaxID=1895847 RepID=UPI0026303492|nr:hypothetical protein [Sphingomonas bacterium]MDB5707008.1 hypothetical protein [Sphingomonas bacterium]